jgi:hypothetical protein
VVRRARGKALGQDQSIVLVGFAVMLWLVIREEVPANQRDMDTPARSPGWYRA